MQSMGTSLETKIELIASKVNEIQDNLNRDNLKVHSILSTSKLLGLSIPTVRSLLDSGKLKYSQVGKRKLIRQEDINQFLLNCQRT